MKKTILAATLAAAFALPAHAADVHFEGPDGEKMEFNFEVDLNEILAEADEARAAAAAARAKAREEHARAREEAGRAREEAGRAREEAARALAEVDMFNADFSNSMMYMFTDRAGRGRVVKGAPYSADIVTETNQTLPDGNVISHKNLSKVWRDGEGRTRQETYRGEKLRSVYISDPVAGMSYTLIPDRKVAVQIPRMDMTRHMVAPRAHVETSTKGRTTTTTETSTDGTKRVIVRTVDSDGTPGVREEVRVQVVRVGDDSTVHIAPVPPVPPVPPTPATPPTPPIPPIPPMAMIPGVHTMRFESTSHLGKGETKTLSAKDFEGVKAEGRATTWTIPAGQIGNQKPIQVVSESWYSPDLQVTVFSRHNDPRTGESLYRLASLKRAEPSSDLFKVPEGYTMKGRGSRAKDGEAGEKPKAK